MLGGSNLLWVGGVFGLLLVIVFFLRKASKGQGRAEGLQEARAEHNEITNEQNEVVAAENKAIVEEVEKTNEVHDRLQSDPAYAQRVRDRFTRPD